MSRTLNSDRLSITHLTRHRATLTIHLPLSALCAHNQLTQVSLMPRIGDPVHADQGTRALAHASKNSATLHDALFFCCGACFRGELAVHVVEELVPDSSYSNWSNCFSH